MIHGGRAFDYIIVGGGISGMSAAYHLADSGRTLLLERERSGAYHSTGRSAAILVLTYGPEAVRALSRYSLPFLRNPPPEFSTTELVQRRAVLHVADHDHIELLHDFRRDPDRAAATTEIDAAEALQRVPILRADYVARALLESNCWDLDVHAIHEGFRRAALKRGLEICFNADIRSIDRQTERWMLSTEREQFTGAILVNAAGAWADSLAVTAGVKPLGIQPKRRTIVLVGAPVADIRPWPMVVDAQESFYFKPEAGKLLLSPADATDSAPVDAQPEELDIAIAIDRLQHATTLDIRRIERSWAGLRNFAPDGVPVIGFDPSDDRFFWLAGQGGYGIQMAAGASALCADLVSRRPVRAELQAAGVDPACLSPARFAGEDDHP